jgi:hypothetical protein
MLEVFESLLMLCAANPEHRNASPRALWAKQNRARWASVHMRIKKNRKAIELNPLDTRCFRSYDVSAVDARRSHAMRLTKHSQVQRTSHAI